MIEYKPIWELQNSKNIIDRQRFVKRVKTEFIPEIIRRIGNTTDEWELKTEKELLKRLKIMLSNYDIYCQKVDNRCRTCNEVECVCYVLQPEITEKELNKLF